MMFAGRRGIGKTEFLKTFSGLLTLPMDYWRVRDCLGMDYRILDLHNNRIEWTVEPRTVVFVKDHDCLPLVTKYIRTVKSPNVKLSVVAMSRVPMRSIFRGVPVYYYSPGHKDSELHAELIMNRVLV
jgi:hypothetical protein